MDDGRLTVFRWLAGGATGLASATGIVDYHGPGRGAGQFDHRVPRGASADGRRRVHRQGGRADPPLHPSDGRHRGAEPARRRAPLVLHGVPPGAGRVPARQGASAASSTRCTRTRRRACCTTRAGWPTHERPYLDRPEVLEFPTETWAAQDMRKADVFLVGRAARDGRRASTQFLERAQAFFDYSVDYARARARRVTSRGPWS